jgi:MFS family permease
MFKPPFTKIVLLLTLSDIFSWGVFYSTSAIVGIYLAGKLGGNAIEYVGIGTGIYMFVRAVLQLPIGIFADKKRRDLDEILILIAANILMGLPFILYPWISAAWHYYGLQAILGVGTAMSLVSWRKLFAGNLDHNQEGKEYAAYETMMSLATAVLSVIAGVVGNINQVYFDLVITLAGIIMALGGIWPGLLLYIHKRRSNHN